MEINGVAVILLGISSKKLSPWQTTLANKVDHTSECADQLRWPHGYYHPSFAFPSKWRLLSSMKGEIFKWSYQKTLFLNVGPAGVPSWIQMARMKKRVRKRLCMCVYVCAHTHTEWASETKMARGNGLCFVRIPSLWYLFYQSPLYQGNCCNIIIWWSQLNKQCLDRCVYSSQWAAIIT